MRKVGRQTGPEPAPQVRLRRARDGRTLSRGAHEPCPASARLRTGTVERLRRAGAVADVAAPVGIRSSDTAHRPAPREGASSLQTPRTGNSTVGRLVAQIRSVGVLGAGTMGHGIAEAAALAGFEVTIYDVRQDFLDAGRREDSLERLEAGGEGRARSGEEQGGARPGPTRRSTCGPVRRRSTWSSRPSPRSFRSRPRSSGSSTERTSARYSRRTPARYRSREIARSTSTAGEVRGNALLQSAGPDAPGRGDPGGPDRPGDGRRRDLVREGARESRSCSAGRTSRGSSSTGSWAPC